MVKIIPCDKIVPVQQIIPGIDVNGITSTEDIADGKSRDHPHNIGLANHTICFRQVEPFITRLEGFRGQVVVDLGAGDTCIAYNSVRNAGARAYIAVEPFFTIGLYYDISKHIQALEKYQRTEIITPEIKETLFLNSCGHEYSRFTEKGEKPKNMDMLVSIVDDDMLTFLKRLPNNSVSLLVSGIDSNRIIKDDYQKETAKELTRVLSLQGCLFRCAESFDPAMSYGNKKLTKEKIHRGRDKNDWRGYLGDVYRKV
jgi:hypothetical protein